MQHRLEFDARVGAHHPTERRHEHRPRAIAFGVDDARVRVRRLQPEAERSIGCPIELGAEAEQLANAIGALVDQDVDGRVMVSARSADAGAWIEIAVRDNGAGIPSEQVDTIFDPLITTRPEGIGLGLSICKMIVQAHGGRIWLASSVPGATEFRFTLPAASTDAA